MQQIFSNRNLTIGQLVDRIETGDLGLPELQRPFVWKDSKVRDLFDSLMRGYPIGYLMLWDCPNIDKKKHINQEIAADNSPREVIIDGQQRLTSLYAVIKGKPVVDDNYAERDITISFNPLNGKFEVGTSATNKDPEWIYNISDVFKTSSYLFISEYINRLRDYRVQKGGDLLKSEEETAAKNIIELEAIKNHILPVFGIIADAEEEDVSEIFVRVNSGGVPLKQNDFILTLLSLYWDEGRRQIERFSITSKTVPNQGETTAYNLITDVMPQDIVRVVMAYAFDRARLKYGYKLLRGSDFDKKGSVNEDLREERFEILKNKLPDVLNVHIWHEFLKGIMNAGYLSGDLILSGNAIFYSYAMYLIAKYRFGVSYNDNLHMTSLWFFYASLVSLYTGSFESTVEQHLNAIKELTTAEEYRRFILSRVQERMTSDFFKITLCGTEGLAVSGRSNNAFNAYVASLNILNAKVLFSKGNLLLSKLFEPGTDGKRKSLEIHHLFPKAYLKSLGYPDSKINQMANYAYIDWKDNMEILDDAPSKYYPIICEGKSEEEIRLMEEENALPANWTTMDYEEFLLERRRLMSAKIESAYEILLKNVF